MSDLLYKLQDLVAGNTIVRSLLLIALSLGLVLQIVPVMIWLERKLCAYIQDRVGPNRAALFGTLRAGGFFHTLTDAVKLLTKEHIRPEASNRFLFLLAPFLVVAPVLLTVAVLPWADEVRITDGRMVPLQVARLDVGVLYIFAVAGLTVFGILLAGWSSNNKYSLLGGLRAASQLVSYEVGLTLAAVSLMVTFGTVKLEDMVAQQEGWRLGVVYQPLAFVIFLVATFAESNRVPFDLPEGESELVAGYHTEYTGFKFGLFMMAEYVHMIVSSIVIACVFFGGWQVPGLPTAELKANIVPVLRSMLIGGSVVAILLGIVCMRRYLTGPHRWKDRSDIEPAFWGTLLLIAGAVQLALAIAGVTRLTADAVPWAAAFVQLNMLLLKSSFFLFLYLWVRWTLPRFRFDQVMRLGWKMLMPLALANIVVTAAVITFSGRA
jgi:NADH-quinone oxidoreductase subunit H